MKVTVLGSGTSHGVPSIGCDCAVCTSTDPRDHRTRPSILIELPAPDDPAYAASAPSAFAGAVRSILVDTSTDLRAQALARNVRRVDAILFTHTTPITCRAGRCPATTRCSARNPFTATR